MIKINEIEMGDYVLAVFEEKVWEGEVVGIQKDQQMVLVKTEVQEFWFDLNHLNPLPMEDSSLIDLGFAKESLPDGKVKYKKGAFRLVIDKENDFSSVDMWYREDRRHHPRVHYIHELQNQFHDMTKMHLSKN